MKKKSTCGLNWGNFLKCLYTIIVLIFIGCQKESIEMIDESTDVNLTQTSALNSLIHNVSLHDGSFDDIIDGANCFSLVYPYTIILNGFNKEIKSQEDLLEISKEDSITIKFPVEVAHSSHEITILNSKKELSTLASSCVAYSDPDIECIDFEYPITFAIFNEDTRQIGTLIIGHDAALYGLTLEIVKDNALSIQYPITLRLHDGTTIMVNHNKELQEYILDFSESCDEQD